MNTLRWSGAENYGYWPDYMHDDRAEVIRAWAEGHVERVFGKALTPR